MTKEPLKEHLSKSSTNNFFHHFHYFHYFRYFWLLASIFTSLIFCLASPLQGQEKRKILSFSKGVGFANNQDLIISSLSRLGASRGGIFSYQYISHSQFHFIRTAGGMGRPLINNALATNLPNAYTDWKLELNLSYGSLLSIHSGYAYNLFLGLGIEEKLNVWLIDFFRAYGIGNAFTLGGQFAFVYEKNHRQLRLYYYLPIIGIHSKPYYNTYHQELIEIVEGNREILNSIFNLLADTPALFSWNNAFNMILRVEYEWEINRNIGIVFHCQASVFYNRRQSYNKITNSYDFFSGLSLYL